MPKSVVTAHVRYLMLTYFFSGLAALIVSTIYIALGTAEVQSTYAAFQTKQISITQFIASYNSPRSSK